MERYIQESGIRNPPFDKLRDHPSTGSGTDQESGIKNQESALRQAQGPLRNQESRIRNPKSFASFVIFA
jgi:hypothetical protein